MICMQLYLDPTQWTLEMRSIADTENLVKLNRRSQILSCQTAGITDPQRGGIIRRREMRLVHFLL